MPPTPIPYSKTKCLWFWYKINGFYFRVPQKPKTENTNWVHLQRMFKYIIWCPTGFYFGASFFLIFIADLLYLNYDLDFASYADETTPYICGPDFSSIINFLEPNANTLFNWPRQNGLIENSGHMKKVSENTWLNYNVKFLRRALGGFDWSWTYFSRSYYKTLL